MVHQQVNAQSDPEPGNSHRCKGLPKKVHPPKNRPQRPGREHKQGGILLCRFGETQKLSPAHRQQAEPPASQGPSAEPHPPPRQPSCMRCLLRLEYVLSTTTRTTSRAVSAWPCACKAFLLKNHQQQQQRLSPQHHHRAEPPASQGPSAMPHPPPSQPSCRSAASSAPQP